MVRRQIIRVLLLPIILYGGCGAPDLQPRKTGEPLTFIYVVSHGWHTGIVVKRDDIPPGIWPEHDDFPTATYLHIGWGDKEYYQAPQPTLGLALKAALKATPSVLHIVGFTLPVEIYFPKSDVIQIALSRQGVARLSRFIHRTYERDAGGQTIFLGPGFFPDSKFYLATGKYHLFNNCNHWTAKALKAAGCPVRPAQAMTAGNVMSQASRFGTIIRLDTGDLEQDNPVFLPD